MNELKKKNNNSQNQKQSIESLLYLKIFINIYYKIK